MTSGVLSGDFDDGAAGFGRLGDRGDQPQAAQTGVETGQRSQLANAGDLIEENAGLVGEQVGHAVPDAARVHRQAALDVGMLRADEHPPGAADVAADIVGRDLEFAGAVQIPRRRTFGSEQLEGKTVG